MSLLQLLELKIKERQKAYQSLLHVSTQYDSSKTRLELLSDYRLNYMQQLEASLEQLPNRAAFISHLDIALNQLNLQLTELLKKRHYYNLLYKKAQRNEDVIIMLIQNKQTLENSKSQGC